MTNDDARKRAQKPVIGRPFVKGQAPGPGRPKLPPWFKARGDDALKTLLAAATGIAAEDDPPGAKELAASCSDRVRLTAALAVIDRVYGKVTDTVELAGNEGITGIQRIIVGFVSPSPPGA